MAKPTNQQTFTIGRASTCDLVLADESVSRKHAELLVLDTAELFLVDCKSTHGTRISRGADSRAVRQEFLPLDATVHFGDVSLPVNELLDALRARRPDAVLPRAPRAAAGGAGAAAGDGQAARRGSSWVQGKNLVRCACGTVKPKGQRCPECGE